MKAPFFMAKTTASVLMSDDVDAITTYATIAVADPKAPFEFRALGPVVWASQVAGLTLGLYVVDPLQLREDKGLDEIWYSGFNPVYWPVTEKAQRAKDWLFNDDDQPAIWDLW